MAEAPQTTMSMEMPRARQLLATTLRVLQEEPPGPDLSDAVHHLVYAIHHLDAIDQVRGASLDEHLDGAGSHGTTALAVVRAVVAHAPAEAGELTEALRTVQRSIELALELVSASAARHGLRHQPRVESVRPATPSRRPATSAVADDRRTTPRARLDIGIAIASDHNFWMGLTEDVSSGGVFVATWQPLKVGTEVELTFTLPGDFEVTCEGIVCWLRQPRAGDVDTVPGMGVRFTSLPTGAAAIIQRFVAKRAALYWDE